MKKLLLIFLLVSVKLLTAQDFPEPMSPPRLVNDFADAIAPGEEARLEQKLVAFNDSTSTQIAVVFIRSVGDYDIAQYGAELAEKWGIGQAEKRNGVLLLTAVEDRKVTIQVGYGLEPVITDALSKLIIEQDILPHYRQGQYYQGVNAATDKLMQLAAGEFPAELRQAMERGEKGAPRGGLILLGLFILIMFLLFRRGGRGGGKREYIGPDRHIPPIIWGGMLGGRRHSGYWGDFSGGGGHFGGGGGFGGFGGGSFGGGGASGSW